jgi:Ni,Fe-hydrogenase III small subunit
LNSKYARKVHALAPAIVLAALLVVTMIFENAVPAAVVHSEPALEEDCFCHKGLNSVLTVNGTPVQLYLPKVKAGASFSLLIKADFIALDSSPMVVPEVGFAPDVRDFDNSKFKFDPSQILDNSPKDQDPLPNVILGLFTVTAPTELDVYYLEVSYRKMTSTIVTQVISDTGAVSPSFAAITKVGVPAASTPGDNVTVNILLQNNRTVASEFYVYATNSSDRKQVMFSKVYSHTPVVPNGTIALRGAFKMPNATVLLMIHSGHVENGKDVDDDRFSVSVLQSFPPPTPVPIGVLTREWAPWITLMAATMGSVPLIATYARRGKRLSPKAEKLKLAVVECADCSLCNTAMRELEATALDRFGDKVALAPVVGTGKQESVDVAFVIGAIRTAKDIEAAKEARARAKNLVSFGACSVFGMWSPEHRRRVDANARGLRKQSSEELVSGPTDSVRPVSDYVKVDLSIPGCPPPMQVILDFIQTEFKNVSGDTVPRIERNRRKRN